MTPTPKHHSDSRIMEASAEVKKEPVHRGLPAGRLIKRKRAPSDSEHGHKRSQGVSGVNSTSRAPSMSKSTKDTAVNSAAGKRKRPIMAQEDVDPEMDSEHIMNAAQALFELLGGAGTSQRESPDRKETPAGGVKWAAKKSRSSRSKKADDCACKLSSSSTTSATVTDVPEVLDSSTSHNHHVAASHARVVEAVNLEEDSEADADAKSTDMSPCGGLGFDRGHKLLSQSSVESTLLDSRAESPSSPLRVLKADADLIPKLEEELMLQFGFQKQPPLRISVTKPSILRKPKVEENCALQLDELKEVKIALKPVQRRKPRASKSKGQPLLLQGDVLDVPIASSVAVLKECIEENKFQVPVTLNLFEPVKLEVGRVKLEGRELYQTGSSTQVRLRSALSEAEKEARRLRRVQANRESARQTIRRKQVLCEDLARKAGELQAEKDDLAQSLEAKSKELVNHQEINRHLKDQIRSQAASAAEAPLASTQASSLASPVPAMASPIQGMPILPYWWAFAVAQSVAAASSQSSAPPQMGEPGAAAVALPPDFNTMFAATVAAFNSGAGMSPNMWMSMMGNMTNKSQIPALAPALDSPPQQQQQQQPQQQSQQQLQQQSTLARPAAGTSEASPQTPAATITTTTAASLAQAPQGLARSPMTVNAHPYPSGSPSTSSPTKSGMPNLDTMSRSQVLDTRQQVNGKLPAGMPSIPSSRVKYQATNGAPSPLVRSLSGMTQMHGSSGDGAASASTTLSLSLGSSHHGRQEQQQLRKPGNLRFFPIIGNGVQGFLGPRLGTYQSEAAALATEARRRRRELKRTKSLQSQLQQEKKLASVKSL